MKLLTLIRNFQPPKDLTPSLYTYLENLNLPYMIYYWSDNFYTRISFASMYDWYHMDELTTSIILPCLVADKNTLVDKNQLQYIFHLFLFSGFVYLVNFIIFSFDIV